MSEYFTFLITVYYESKQTALKCALKIHANRLPDDVLAFPMEPNSRECFHGFLPLHVRTVGPVIDVEQIFEAHTVEDVSR